VNDCKVGGSGSLVLSRVSLGRVGWVLGLRLRVIPFLEKKLSI